DRLYSVVPLVMFRSSGMLRATFVDVGKSYGVDRKALDNINLEIESGELTALLGASGSGKTSMLRLLCGLEHATSGEIRIDGVPIRQRKALQREVALVFRGFALYPHMNVFGNLSFCLVSKGIKRADVYSRLQNVSAWLGLEDILELMPGQLSTIQKFQVALGRAMARDPRLLLLDDPLCDLTLAE